MVRDQQTLHARSLRDLPQRGWYLPCEVSRRGQAPAFETGVTPTGRACCKLETVARVVARILPHRIVRAAARLLVADACQPDSFPESAAGRRKATRRAFRNHFTLFDRDDVMALAQRITAW